MIQSKISSKTYSIVLVTYNRVSFLKKLLFAISEYGWDFSSMIIVDNNSNDGTGEFLASWGEKKGVCVISSSTNVGHGAGIAIALQKLEDDSVPSEALAKILLNAITTSGYDVISPIGSLVKLGRRVSVNPGKGEIKPADFCLLDGAILRYEAIIKTGLPVTDWFMMVDDYEYCYRLRKKGFKIGIAHNTFHEILHAGGGGGFTRSTLWRGYYQSRNHVFFLKEHFTLFHLLDFILLQGKRFLASFIPRDRFQRLWLRTVGLWHGVTGKKGKTLDPETLRYRK